MIRIDYSQIIVWVQRIMEIVNAFFVTYLNVYALFLFLSVIMGSITMFQRYREHRMQNILNQKHFLPVSIIVPAHNEEATVVETVRSLLTLDYTIYEIVIVDDGSTDDTSAKLIEQYQMTEVMRPIHRVVPCKMEEFTYETNSYKVPITLIRKKNGGKADALNMGINASNYPFFICMDADSALQHDSLLRIVNPVLENDHVIAVGGNVRPSNGTTLENGHVTHYEIPKNIWASMQTLEYDRSFLASRFLFDSYNGSLIISGAFGLFKKELVIACGGYDLNTMGEDMELVVKLHVFCIQNHIPYIIKYEPDAICWSQVPESLGDLKKQRERWHLGLFQTLTKHRQIFANRKYGLMGFVSYLYFWIYELLSPFIEVFGLLTMIICMSCRLLNVRFMLLFLTIYAVYSGVLTLASFFTRIYTMNLTLSFKDVFRAFLFCILETVFLRFVMMFVRLTALIGYDKKKMRWYDLKRKKINVQ